MSSNARTTSPARPSADGPRYEGPAADVEAVRSAHRDWWAGNHLTQTQRAARNFAPDTLMFNLNSHTYYGLEEMVPMWDYYSNNLDVDVCELWDYRISVYGDVAVITCEGTFPTKARHTDGAWKASNLEIGGVDEETVPVRFRETSIARRDDGKGNPIWKIWHFHCSPLAPADEPRPPFNDTWISRGGAIGGSIPQTAELPDPVEA